ncbi:uncharacterized protein LOC126899215 [Daktulosphaira vitifoliae]|uniref:uncharacterized protein LOC126899215 n=1 Tax=Daktulosphaira vitifoliae TaxID=58002 RepID=UPI0021AAB7C0|nr:uncharacterized protein LOC126899215 [Daktulosphaira vitifoliae]
MTSSKIVSKCLLLLCVILCIESRRNLIENTKIMNCLLQFNGWQHLTYVNKVIYLKNNIINIWSILNETVTLDNCNTKIRHTTVFLGATYAYFLNDIVQSIECLRVCCSKILKNELHISKSHDCTIKLVKFISNAILLAKKMQGALCAIDIMHSIIWQLRTKSPMILKFALERFIDLENLIAPYSALENYDLETDKNIIYNMRNKLSIINQVIKNDIDRFKIENIETEILKILNTEYTNNYGEKEIVEFVNTGIVLMNSKLNTIEINTYTNLGFEFNSDTGETRIKSE